MGRIRDGHCAMRLMAILRHPCLVSSCGVPAALLGLVSPCQEPTVPLHTFAGSFGCSAPHLGSENSGHCLAALMSSLFPRLQTHVLSVLGSPNFWFHPLPSDLPSRVVGGGGCNPSVFSESLCLLQWLHFAALRASGLPHAGG